MEGKGAFVIAITKSIRQLVGGTESSESSATGRSRRPLRVPPAGLQGVNLSVKHLPEEQRRLGSCARRVAAA